MVSAIVGVLPPLESRRPTVRRASGVPAVGEPAAVGVGPAEREEFDRAAVGGGLPRYRLRPEGGRGGTQEPAELQPSIAAAAAAAAVGQATALAEPSAARVVGR